jgi:hypothetical protein
MVSRFLQCSALTFILVVLLGSVGCSSSNSTRLRFLQAAPVLGNVDVLLDSKTIESGMGYGTPTDYMSVKAGSRHLQVEPTGSSTPVIDQTISLNRGSHYTFIADGFASDISAMLLLDDQSAPASGDIKLRFVNAGAGAGDVDVYVLAPGTTPPGNPPTVGNLSLGVASDYQSIAAGSYEIFVNIAGTTFVYVDTGSLSFAAGQNRTFVLLSDLAGGFRLVTLHDLN